MELSRTELQQMLDAAAQKAVALYRAQDQLQEVWENKSQAARRLGRSRTTIREMVNRGEIKILPNGKYTLA
jgi:predicted DNA-binding protein (UPF0251 family)